MMDGTCFVCKDIMVPYFEKDFGGAWDLGIVEYWKCTGCGMVVSKTHQEMPDARWVKLNRQYHSSFQVGEYLCDDPRWIDRLRAQASVISELATRKVLPAKLPWIDHGCGDGKLANMLGERGLSVLKFDKYMSHDDYLTEDELASTKYDLVISTSVFEHLCSIQSLDEIVDLCAQSGILALHTMVKESIPQDPSWFYLLPVHSSFFTNRSMQVLFDRWGFTNSVYHPVSSMWFCLRQGMELFPESDGYHSSEGFMGYWK